MGLRDGHITVPEQLLGFLQLHGAEKGEWRDKDTGLRSHVFIDGPWLKWLHLADDG